MEYENLTLRDLRPNDLPLLLELLQKIDIFDADDRSVAMELLTIIIEQPTQKEYCCIVASDSEDNPLGYSCFGPTPLTEGTFDLYWIVVYPSYAGQGIGSQLLLAVEDRIRQEHGRMLIIETSSKESYARTRQFYRKNGFCLAETIKDFYRQGEDRVTYLKRLIYTPKTDVIERSPIPG
jgi:ribosomal protein S18 acetylase RimI-like enzyme